MGLIEFDVCERLWRRYINLMRGRQFTELSIDEKHKLINLLAKANKAIDREIDKGSKRPATRWKKWADLHQKMIYEYWAYGNSGVSEQSGKCRKKKKC